MKNIVVPSDFSPNAYAALYYISKLFVGEKVRILVLNSIEEEVSMLTSRVDSARSEQIVKQLVDDSEKDGQKLLQKIKQDTNQNPKHEYEVFVTSNPLTKAINDFVIAEGVDLVAVGSKGRTAAVDVLMGSTTTKIIQTLQGCPLLVVPLHVEFVIPANIVYATDFNDFYRLSQLKAITRLVRQFRSQIHLLHVGSENELNSHQSQNMEKFRNDLSEYDVEFHFVPKTGTISKSIHHFIDSESMDLLALVYHKHTFIKALFREPVVSRVGKHTHVPTMVIPMT